MATHNMNFEQTYNYLKSRRPIVYTPNVNFRRSLDTYYKNNLHRKDALN
jgi:hypothetical protein